MEGQLPKKDESSTKSSSSKRSKKERSNCTRSMRSGRRTILTSRRTSSKPSTSSKLPAQQRISTRASRRNTTSPLRELPMYGVKKKRKRKTKRQKSPLQTKKQGKNETEKTTSSGSGISRRPSRKTKESAAFFLNLITKNFSSDENENGEKSEEQSEGDTSSSETKFLENRYKAIMKRDEQKGNSKKSNCKPGRRETKQKAPISDRKYRQNEAKSSRTEKRVLRSESSRKEQEQKIGPVATRNSTRRAAMSTEKNKSEEPIHAGAARKSASVFPKKSKPSSSSSSRSSSGSEDSSSSSSSSSDSDNESKIEESGSRRPKISKNVDSSKRNKTARSAKVTVAKSQKVTEIESTDDSSVSESDEEGIDEVADSGQQSPSPSASAVGEVCSIYENEHQKSDSSYTSTVSDSEESVSTSSEEEVVEKVEIAIQVDMDLEESLEQERINCIGQQTDDPPPPVLTPHFVNQGCQSEFPPSHSSAVHVSQQQGTVTISHPPMTHPPPPLLSFPGPNFYPGLTNFEFVSQQRTQQDFSLMLPTIGLPTVSTYSFGPSTVLTHNQIPTIPIGYSSTSISAATTLQTHIRSVAANLDIPLVRPIVTQTNLVSSLPLTRPSQLIDPNRPLTRPIVNTWLDSSRTQGANQHQQHYSAFRVPASTTVISGDPQRLISASSLPKTHYSNIQSEYLHSPQRFQPHPGPNQNRVSVGGTQVLQRQTANLTSSNHPGISAHGLSLIQSLPNVSIVPKFDRSAKTVVIRPDQQPTSSTATQETTELIKKASRPKKEKTGPPKEKGRKRKVLPFTKDPSPLLVRKDSTNPITYVGKATKKNMKGMDSDNCESVCYSGSHFNQLILNNEDANDDKKKVLAVAPSQSEEIGNGSHMHSKHTNLEEYDTKFLFSNLETRDSERIDVKSVIKITEMEKSKPHLSDKSDNIKSQDKDPEYKQSDVSDDKLSKPKKTKHGGERPRGGKTEAESPRPASVSSERSSRVSESHDDIKVEDILAYYPTEDEFQDPLKYIEQIQEEAKQYGIARIVPPKSFRPECNVEDDMRFTAYNHYIHRMHQRWGPNVHVRVGIMEHLKRSKVRVISSNPPIIGGMEVDLTTLYHTVQSFGGLTEVIQKDKWNKVSDAMNIPKAANDRASKLDAVYVKYVLPYEMLSESERKKLLNEVEKRWKIRMNRNPESDCDSDEDDPLVETEDCVIKGKSTPLSSYYRVARNTMNMLFKNKDPTPGEVESGYWKLVRERDRHLCVYSGSIDCAGLGWGFPLPKNGANHPWNLKILASNAGSILKSMGSVMGATVPTLHVGMVFTTYCWYRDPHNLPWVEYLHSGSNKIWYVIPASHENNFRQVLKELMPRQCKDKKIWLTSDSAMVPPEVLLSHGIPLFRAVQNPGEFVVVFPKAFTSAICTGYVISESVCFAPPDWLKSALETFKDIRESKEPPVFPLDKLICSILSDTTVSEEVLKLALPIAEILFHEELALRKKLRDLGIGTGKGARLEEKGKKSTKNDEDEVVECDSCNYVLNLSMVTHKSNKFNYCLPHAVQHLSKNKSKMKASTLIYEETDAQLRSILKAAQSRLK